MKDILVVNGIMVKIETVGDSDRFNVQTSWRERDSFNEEFIVSQSFDDLDGFEVTNKINNLRNSI